MRPIVIGVGAACCIYILNVLPGVLAFLIGLGVAVATGFIGAHVNTEKFLQDLMTPIVSMLPSGSGLPRATVPASTRPQTVREVQRTLRTAGLENCSLIVGLDFTKSNTEQGLVTYGGRSLHNVSEFAHEKRLNPYQSVISIVGETLAAFDDDGLIPAFYFGDKTTRDHSVKPLGEKPANGFTELLDQYAATVGNVQLDGPTSFGPLIEKACDIVRESGYEFHILVVITDGAVNDRNNETMRAIVDAAASYPLAIIAVGVGDGPWDEMRKFDDELPERRFDNFTFVNYEEIRRKFDGSDVVFAEEALRETPIQYKFARANGYMGARSDAHHGQQRRRRSPTTGRH
jgi:E3 ubiquitin-protein ligase RGLG